MTINRISNTSLLDQAIAKLQQGLLEESRLVFLKILELDPNHADANHLLGVIEIQRGNHESAIRLIARAIRARPLVAMYYSNYCLALHRAARPKEALAACEQSLKLGSAVPETHFNHGNILKSLGRIQDAVAAFDTTIKLNPSYVEAYFNRAEALFSTGHTAAAIISLRNLLRINPNNARAHNNLAVALVHENEHEEALKHFDHAIRLVPDYAQAHNRRAELLRKLQQHEAALQACDRAIACAPDYADAHYNRGNILLSTGFAKEAEASYQRAHELNPTHAQLHSNVLFVQVANACLPHEKMLEELRGWDEQHGKSNRKPFIHPPGPSEDQPARRLRVGYVSPDLRKNVISFFFEPLLSAHDKAHFEIFCYASFSEARADAYTHRLQKSAEHWRYVGHLDDAALAQLIFNDHIDILIDLSGHTANNRLKAFTYRPAPIQASYLGFFASTGLSAMDYWITDEVLHPNDTPELASEHVYRLPRCWVCYQAPEDAPDVSPCPSQDEQVVFGSFNQLSKLTPRVIETWSTLLCRLPGSRLRVMARTLADPLIQSKLLDQFAGHGIKPEQLDLRKGGTYDEYFASLSEVDIALDPFPRTGGTTTAEALWMGVPVITLAGTRYVERISASKLTALGLEDLITSSQDEYIEKAVSLARNPGRRAELRATLRPRMAQSSLCNSLDLAQSIEAAYHSMWRASITGRAKPKSDHSP